jgi:hypothetical protein
MMRSAGTSDSTDLTASSV